MALAIGQPTNTQLNQNLPAQNPAVAGVIRATPGSNGFATLNAPAAPAAAPANANPGGGTVSSGSGSGSSILTPQYLQGIEQEYGATINNAPTAQGILNSQEGAAEQQYNDAAGVAIANAQQQNTGNQAYLQNQINSTQQGQNLSLSELASQIRAQHQGLGAQLGTVGAGSSSAALLGDQGLAQEQNTQRANVQQSAGADITGLETQQKAQTADLNTLVTGYQKTAADQVATVKANYAQLMNQLAVSLNQAQGEEKARLAEFGQSLTGAANAALGNIESQLQNNTNTLLTQGTAKLSEGSLPTPTGVDPINMAQVTPFTASAGSGNATSSGAPAGGSLYSLLQQQSGQPVTA